jgi:hypothetical protein
MKTNIIIENWRRFLNEGDQEDPGQFVDPDDPEPQGPQLEADPDLVDADPNTNSAALEDQDIFQGKSGEVLSADKIKALDILSNSGDIDINFSYSSQGIIVSLGDKSYLIDKSGSASEYFGD